jgi:Ca-activated chloride channel family protein
MPTLTSSRVWHTAFFAIASLALVCAAGSPVCRAGARRAAGQVGRARVREQQRGEIRVEVNLVNVLVSVLDEHNRPAPDLPREAFEVYEEDVPQRIEVFEPETQQPLDLVLMIDASLSTYIDMALEKEAAAHFIRQVLRSGDRLSVYAFDENVTQLAGFSNDVSTLQGAVRRIAEGAGTSIYDAVYVGSQALERRSLDRRRVIVMVTDAGETTSRLDFDAARREAVRAGALLYTIVIRAV